MTRRIQSLLTAAAITLLPGAGPVHAASPVDGTASLELHPPTTIVGVRDLRGTFRSAVCARLPADGPQCAEVLLKLASEPPSAALDRVDDLASRYRIAFIPGLFSECFEDLACPIAVVVSVAGASNGSPLADRMHAIYRSLGARFPLPGCARGTGDEVLDLHPDSRIAWWQDHGDSLQVPIFALVASPQPDRVSPATRATYNELAKIDPRNDGKLLWHDQIPPRTALVDAAIAVVASTRAAGTGHGPPPAAGDAGNRE
jgi:hypothetical protein